LVHFKLEKRVWGVSIHNINRTGCAAYYHCDFRNCRYTAYRHLNMCRYTVSDNTAS